MRMKASMPARRGRNGFLVLVALLAVVAVLVALYRSASHDELPDDEWLDFEHPTG
jgi:hypothetical protein